ncbi:hypothetical protein RRG08_009443, partial [Elysia crispata]
VYCKVLIASVESEKRCDALYLLRHGFLQFPFYKASKDLVFGPSQ